MEKIFTSDFPTRFFTSLFFILQVSGPVSLFPRDVANLPLMHRSKDQAPDPSLKSYLHILPRIDPGYFFVWKKTREVLAIKKRRETRKVKNA